MAVWARAAGRDTDGGNCTCGGIGVFFSTMIKNIYYKKDREYLVLHYLCNNLINLPHYGKT